MIISIGPLHFCTFQLGCQLHPLQTSTCGSQYELKRLSSYYFAVFRTGLQSKKAWEFAEGFATRRLVALVLKRLWGCLGVGEGKATGSKGQSRTDLTASSLLLVKDDPSQVHPGRSRLCGFVRGPPGLGRSGRRYRGDQD